MESLNNDNFVSKIKLDKDQKEKIKQDKQQEIIDKRNDRLQKKMEKEMERASKVKKTKKEDEENDEENDTTDLGDLQNKSKICKLYKKIVKYKEMFPELSMIKLNRNDSEEKMQSIILECQDHRATGTNYIKNKVQYFWFDDRIEKKQKNCKFNTAMQHEVWVVL